MNDKERYEKALDKMASDFCSMAQNFCDECDVGIKYESIHGNGSCVGKCKELYIQYYLNL
jgi:hypothetical protein